MLKGSVSSVEIEQRNSDCKRNGEARNREIILLGLVEQLYLGHHALFDLETIKCAFLSVEQTSCGASDLTAETQHGNMLMK